MVKIETHSKENRITLTDNREKIECLNSQFYSVFSIKQNDFQIGKEKNEKWKILSKEILGEILDFFNIIKSSGSFKFISKIQKEFAGMI